jgi:hypothetical protein
VLRPVESVMHRRTCFLPVQACSLPGPVRYLPEHHVITVSHCMLRALKGRLSSHMHELPLLLCPYRGRPDMLRILSIPHPGNEYPVNP